MSVIFPNSLKPIQNGINQYTIPLNIETITSVNNNSILQNSMNNNIYSQGQIYNSYGSLVNGYYTLNNQLNNQISNNGGYTIGQINNITNNIGQLGTNNKSKVIQIKKKDLSSSGILLRSSRSSKYNKVLKNGKKIRNIDINNDCQDNKNDDDTESLSTNSIAKKKNITYAKDMNNLNLINKKSSTQIKKTKKNYSPKSVDKLMDKTNRKINKRESESQSNMKEETKNNQNNEKLNHKVKNVKTKVTQNNNNTNIKIKDNLNQKENIKPNPGNKYPDNVNKNNTSTNSNQIESSQKQNPKSNNNIKIPNRTSDKNQNPISNNQLDQGSNNKDSNDLSDNQSKTIKNEENKQCESKISNSKFPTQPQNDLINSSQNNINNYINLDAILINGNPIINQNMNINTNIYSNQSDNYLVSNLGEYLEKEVGFKPIIDDNLNNQNGKGFRSCSELSQAGKNVKGEIKINQDTPLISLSIGGIIGFNLFGVLDGHGIHGHFVSQYCKDYFIKNMTNYIELLKISNGMESAEEIYNELKNTKFSYITELFTQADTELLTQNNFDYSLSGTTCNIVFQFNNHLVCFSVGDSRGILIYDQGDNLNQGILALSTDHKPDLPGELERIKLSGGTVDYAKDIFGNNLGPSRVYKTGFNYPGLAMSRSLGDLQAKEVGVIPNPQIIEYDINQTTKYIVICSDGVWEFASNEQVRDIGNIFYPKNDVAGFCNQLVNFAINLWEQFDIIRDDITVVSVFF